MPQHNIYYSHSNQHSRHPEYSSNEQNHRDMTFKSTARQTNNPSSVAGLGLSLSMPSGANSTSPQMVAPADHTLGFSFESPQVPQGSPTIYTPLSFQPQGHAWSPDGYVRRPSNTASTLSLDDSCPPSNTSFEESVGNINFTEVNFLSSRDPQPIGLGLGLMNGPVANSVPSLPSQKVPANEPNYDLSSSDNINTDIEFLLKSEPFSETEKDWFSDSKNDPFSAEFFSVKEEPHEGPSENDLFSDISAAVSSSSLTASGKKSAPTTPRKLRKAKSFNSGATRYTPNTNFSMDKCLNEFHAQEGKILFRDETARISKQSSSPSLTKKKSVSKFQNFGQQFARSKTSPHLGSYGLSKVGGNHKQEMDAGFGFFQVELNPETSSSSNTSVS